MKKIWPVFILFFAFIKVNSQTNVFEFKGRIIDSINLQPLKDAIVTVKGTQQNSFTNNKGEFSLSSKKTDCIIVVYQIGYKTREVKLDTAQNTIIKLMPMAFNLNEIVVSASKFKIIQENNNTSFLSFEFYDNLIVALVSKDYGPNSNYLQLLDLNGDVVSEKKAPKNTEHLFKDCLNNVQVITKDSVYQFYYNYNNIVFLPPYPIKKFYSSLYNCKLYANGNYYFKDRAFKNLKNTYKYVNDTLLNTTVLHVIEDSVAIKTISAMFNLQYFLNKRMLSGNPPWNVNTIKANINTLIEMEPLPAKSARLFSPIESEIVGIDTTIYIFDYTNKKALRFNSNNQLVLKDSLNYSHAIKPSVLIDHDFKKTYFLSNNDQCIIYDYNLETKKLTLKENLEKFHYVNNLHIKGNIAYFLYKPKAETIHKKLFIYRFSE